MDGSLLLLGLSGPELTAEEAARLRRLQPAGYILSEHNLVSPGQTRELTDKLRELSLDLPIIAIGHEHVHIAPAPPTATDLAAAKSLPKIADAGALTGDLLHLLGINLNLGPVLDLDDSPDKRHCWGIDSQRVIDHAGQWNRWMRKHAVAGCAKYFPAPSPATLEELLRRDVIPYTALMPELDCIMPTHVRFPTIDPEFPASLSPRIIRRFLRDQLGFDRHLVINDALDNPVITQRYGHGTAAKLAIEAGCDLVITRKAAETAAQALAKLPHPMLEEARERVERFRRKKLKPPLPWSDKKWSATCAALEDLAASL